MEAQMAAAKRKGSLRNFVGEMRRKSRLSERHAHERVQVPSEPFLMAPAAYVLS